MSILLIYICILENHVEVFGLFLMAAVTISVITISESAENYLRDTK